MSKFIAFEGIDGCGKTTQIRLLKDYLESIGEKVWVTAEPSSGPIGKLIRDIQKDRVIENPTEMTMMCLYAADRAEHVKEIQQHINNGEWVLCDRYKYSSYAYQDFENKWVTASEINFDYLDADITLIIDIPAEEAMKRIDSRGEEKEIFEKQEFLEKVRSKYIRVYHEDDYTMVGLIDGMQTPDKVFSYTRDIVDRVRRK